MALRPMTAVMGDLYGLGMLIADVMGHKVPADLRAVRNSRLLFLDALNGNRPIRHFLSNAATLISRTL
jgi:hypothetical protein